MVKVSQTICILDFLQKYELKTNDVVLFLLLHQYVDRINKTCYPSVSTLARLLGVSEPTVRKSKMTLQEKGLIAVFEEYDDKGAQRADTIKILSDDVIMSFKSTNESITFNTESKANTKQRGGKKTCDGGVKNFAGGGKKTCDELSNHINYNNHINNNNYSSIENFDLTSKSEQSKASNTSNAIAKQASEARTTKGNNSTLKAKKELINNCPPSSVAPPKFYNETSGDELWQYIESDESGISIGALKAMCSGYGTFLKRNYKIEPTVDNLKAIVNRFCKWKADSEVSTVFNPAKAFKEMTKSTNTFEFFAAELNRADKPSGSGGQKGSSSKVELKTAYKGDSQMPIYLVSHYEQGIPVLKERPESTIASKAENRPYIFEGVYYARNLMLLNKLRADNDIPPFSHIPTRCQTIEDKERWLINQDSTDDLKI